MTLRKDERDPRPRDIEHVTLHGQLFISDDQTEPDSSWKINESAIDGQLPGEWRVRSGRFHVDGRPGGLGEVTVETDHGQINEVVSEANTGPTEELDFEMTAEEDVGRRHGHRTNTSCV